MTYPLIITIINPVQLLAIIARNLMSQVGKHSDKLCPATLEKSERENAHQRLNHCHPGFDLPGPSA
jgi:hypothetical protein